MNENISIKHNTTHYDSVTDAWLYILGKNLHYGYFKSQDMFLDDASEHLIDILSEKGDMDENSTVLDVGCGIGTPAIYLHNKYKSVITGISTSERGVFLANQTAENVNISDKVVFKISDALDNGLPTGTFDVIWQMESSHLMPDKKKLFSENSRVLKRNGKLLLCDLILKKELNIAEIYKYRKDLEILEKSFGKAKMVTLGNYKDFLSETGFTDIETTDISDFAFPTLNCWKENIDRNKDKISENFNGEMIDYFIQSCDILSSFFKENVLGYGIVTARKTEKK